MLKILSCKALWENFKLHRNFRKHNFRPQNSPVDSRRNYCTKCPKTGNHIVVYVHAKKNSWWFEKFSFAFCWVDLINPFYKRNKALKKKNTQKNNIRVTAYFITVMSTCRLSDIVIVNTIWISTIYVTIVTMTIRRSTTCTISLSICWPSLPSTMTIFSWKSKKFVVDTSLLEFTLELYTGIHLQKCSII